MTSSTIISNQALSQLPGGSIVNLDESSLAAKTCKLWYGQVQAELLEKGPWRFQTVRAALAETINERDTRWGYAYVQPAGLAQVLQIVDSGGMGYQSYEWVGNVLFCNVPEASIDYIIASADPLANAATAMFRAALIANLAARIVLPITKDLKRAKFLADAAEVATERAQSHNHNQRDNRYGDHIPDIVKARMGLDFDQRVLEGPETIYPDFDPVGVFESELDT